MGASPGQEGHLYSPPVADGVLRFHLLLVGELESPGDRDIAEGHTRSKGIRPGLRNLDAGRGKKSDARAKPPPDLSWPEALRRVRVWLEPYVMLMRYWRAFSDVPHRRG